METINIQILNPKARQLLKSLVNLRLIAVRPKASLSRLLKELRNNKYAAPSLKEITSEVESVRQARYAKK